MTGHPGGDRGESEEQRRRREEEKRRRREERREDAREAAGELWEEMWDSSGERKHHNRGSAESDVSESFTAGTGGPGGSGGSGGPGGSGGSGGNCGCGGGNRNKSSGCDGCDGCDGCGCDNPCLIGLFSLRVLAALALSALGLGRTVRRVRHEPGAPTGPLAGRLHAAVRYYQLRISPRYGARCRFSPTCSQYGVVALRRHGALKGGLLTVRRISRCRPGSESGADPVP